MTYGHESAAPADWRHLDADRRFALVKQALAGGAPIKRRLSN